VFAVSLTGPLFFLALLVVVLAAFLGLVGSWGRWAGPGWRPAVTRALFLGVVNALVLLTAGVAMNDRYGFYADWHDLGGAVGLLKDPPSAMRHTGGDVTAAVSHPQLRNAAERIEVPENPAQLRRGGRQFRFTVTGRISGLTAAVDVFLPAGYTDPGQWQRRYPVLEGFPGYPGNPFVPSAAVAAVVRARQLVDPIIIAPVAEIPAGRDTECVNGGPTDPALETWLTRDVPDWALRTLRVRPDRTSWATIGWSSGGWCAAMATMLHPDRYAAAIVLGGYFRPDFGTLYHPFGPASVPGRRYDLVALADHRPPAVALWLQTSPADRLSYPSSAQLIARARAPLSVESLVMQHAGHRIAVWQALLPQALHWLAGTLPGFSPTAGYLQAGGAGSGTAPPPARGATVAPAALPAQGRMLLPAGWVHGGSSPVPVRGRAGAGPGGVAV
jgi:hypothetical protein